jgi:hypothetical protein
MAGFITVISLLERSRTEDFNMLQEARGVSKGLLGMRKADEK